MNLIDVHKAFATEEQCYEYLEKMRWPEGVRCPTCGNDRISKFKSPTKKQPHRLLYQCLEKTCKQQFTATAGTIFHDTHLPLTKWFLAVALIVDAKKGISAKQLERHLDVNYRTAWYLAHRIRKAMAENGGSPFDGVVELDETYVGGKQKGKGVYYGKKQKQVVVGVRERGGKLRFVHTKDAKGKTLAEIAARYISPDAKLVVTDDSSAAHIALKSKYGPRHVVINHSSGQYVRGNVHTNTIENAFSLLKRGIIGSFHKVSIKHLHRYLSEFEYRFNRREIAEIFEETVRRLSGFSGMTYKQLTEGA